MIGLLILFGAAAAALFLLVSSIIAYEATHPPRCTAAWAIARGLPVDPAEEGLPFRTWVFDRSDGARLPVWEVDLAADEPCFPDQTVVMLHGWGRSKVDSLQRLRPWRGMAGRAVLIDLRGHGESSGCVCTLGDRDREDVRDLLLHLDTQPIMLVGHSMGACVALAAANDEAVADRIAGVVAYGPYEDVHVPLQCRLALKRRPTRPFTDTALHLLRLVYGIRRVQTLEAARAVSCPVLVVQGRDDRISPAAGAERIAAASRARLEWIEGAAHEDTHSVAAERHDEIVQSFAKSAIEAFQRGAAASAGGAS